MDDNAIEKVGYSHDKDYQLAHELFEYCPATGRLLRKVGRGSAKVGESAGADNGFGYIRVNFNGRLRLRSHLVWLMLKGFWPTLTLDHIDGNRQDDRIENLREVSLKENLHNKRKANKNNRLGLRGVRKSGRLYSTQIGVNGQQIYLGAYSTAERAAAVYEKARLCLHSGVLTGESHG